MAYHPELVDLIVACELCFSQSTTIFHVHFSSTLFLYISTQYCFYFLVLEENYQYCNATTTFHIWYESRYRFIPHGMTKYATSIDNIVVYGVWNKNSGVRMGRYTGSKGARILVDKTFFADKKRLS